VKYEDLNHLGNKLRPDEPWFTLRGQDILAPYAVLSYGNLLLAASSGPGLDGEIRRQLRKASREVNLGAAEMLAWQSDNPNYTHLPD